MKEAIKIEDFYIPPHDVKSREVNQEDVDRMVEDGQLMYELCLAPVGMYKSAYAIAHSQITKDDPLRFFVTRKQELIVNPVITRHSSTKQGKSEGCMTFYNNTPALVPRWHRIEVEFQTIDENGNLTEKMKWKCKGIEAQMVQHEIDHFNAVYIY